MSINSRIWISNNYNKQEVVLTGEKEKEIIVKVKFNSENVCYFFATNRCKLGKDCRKEHPKMCIKFKKIGLTKFNKNGCTENCEYYHPKACFEAMKFGQL